MTFSHLKVPAVTFSDPSHWTALQVFFMCCIGISVGPLTDHNLFRKRIFYYRKNRGLKFFVSDFLSSGRCRTASQLCWTIPHGVVPYVRRAGGRWSDDDIFVAGCSNRQRRGGQGAACGRLRAVSTGGARQLSGDGGNGRMGVYEDTASDVQVQAMPFRV